MTALDVVRGDITTVEVDAIVNAANSSLMGGGGVDGAIHRRGGPAILAKCKEIVALRGGCATGDAVITTGGMLPARHVIYTVGPIWGTVDETGSVALLGACYSRSLDLAATHGLRSVAFPNISTGAYGFPKPLAATTAVAGVRTWLENSDDLVDRIVFACFDEENHALYRSLLT